ncbi:flavin reductase family protein [Streptomyces sp. NPDC059009]|uniref:flavin reductase family protein n=1 Tax=Streptomyces sp. NPDC059009 TaxID=3346694 RepID=UPI0036AD74A7
MTEVLSAADEVAQEAGEAAREVSDVAQEAGAVAPAAGAGAVPQEAVVVAPELLRSVLRHHAKGVAVITAGAEQPVGFCATSLASLSLDPPLVSFTVGLRSSSWPTVRAAPHVMVHLLAEGQEELARTFGGAGAPKFGHGTRWHRGAHGLPVLDDVLAWLAVEPLSHLPAGDHALVVGRVVTARSVTAGAPLVHHDGAFVGLAVGAPEVFSRGT